MSQPITERDLPTLDGTSLTDAKAWFAGLSPLDLLWHPDDPTGDIEFSRPVDEAARNRLDDDMQRLHTGSRHWSDPDLLYDLAGAGVFEVERLHPRFVVDICIPAAGRTGYATLPGQALPTLVVEEVGALVAIRFPSPEGPVSGMPTIDLVLVNGASLDVDGIRLDQASLDESTTRTLPRPEAFSDFEDAVYRFAQAQTAVPKP